MCLCPQSSFRIGNYCLSSLAANEYYGTGCTGLDTITLQVGAYNAADYNIQLAYRKSNIGSPGYSSKGSLTQPFAGFRYRDNNKNLDSIHFFLDTGFPTFTVRDTIRCLVTGSGRFLEGDKLKIQFRYRAINQNNRLVDSCEMILHK